MLNLTTETACQPLCSWDLNIPPIHILPLLIPSARPHSCGLFSLKIAHSTGPFMQARRTLTTHYPQRNGKRTLCGPASRTKAPAPATQEQPLANSLQQRLLLSPVLELEPFSGPKHLQWLCHPLKLNFMPFLSNNAHKKIRRTILQDLIIHRLTLFTAMGFSSCGRWPAEMISKSMDLRSWSAECHDCMSWHIVPSKKRTTKLGKRSVQMGPIVTYDMQIQGKGV